MPTLKTKGVLVVTAMLLASGSAHADGLTITADGSSEFAILLAADAIPAEKFAAEELASHIERMSGAKLTIVNDEGTLPKHAILLGRPRQLSDLGVQLDWSELDEEGYLIRTTKDHLIVAGGRPRGTMYGVYDLLQSSWGCGWFTFDTIYVPSRPTLTLPRLDEIRRPVFRLRDMMVSSGVVHGDWFWPNFDEKYAARVRWNFKTRDFRNTDESHGGSYRIVSFAHNYIWLVPPEKYGAEHPEYYALVDGERLNRPIRGNDVELCLSNPDVADAAAATITGWLRERPDSKMCFIGQSDTGYYCQCDECNAVRRKYGGWDSARRTQIAATRPESDWNVYGGFAGLQIEFANRVAEILEKEFPDVLVGTWAYFFARKPPRGITAHKNLVVWYATWNSQSWPRRSYSDAVDSGPINDDFETFGDEIGEWKRIAKHVFIYDYWLGTWRAQPVHIPTLRRTVRFYRKIGVEGVLIDGLRGIPAGFEWLTFWLWSQLLWNPDFDAERGVEEFCNAYYGAGGPFIKEYIDLASSPDSFEFTSIPGLYNRPNSPRHRTRRFTDDPFTPVRLDKLRDSQLLQRVMSDQAINQGYDLFEKARAAVRGDPKSAKHVEFTRMALQNAMLEWLPGTDPRLPAELEGLIELAKKMKIGYLGYGSRTLEQYAEAVRRKIATGEPLYPIK